MLPRFVTMSRLAGTSLTSSPLYGARFSATVQVGTNAPLRLLLSALLMEVTTPISVRSRINKETSSPTSTAPVDDEDEGGDETEEYGGGGAPGSSGEKKEREEGTQSVDNYVLVVSQVQQERR